MQNISISAFYTKISERLELHSICIETVSWASIYIYTFSLFEVSGDSGGALISATAASTFKIFVYLPCLFDFVSFCFFIFLLVPLRGKSGELLLCTQQLRLAWWMHPYDFYYYFWSFQFRFVCHLQYTECNAVRLYIVRIEMKRSPIKYI